MVSDTAVNSLLQANVVTLALIFAITIGIALIVFARAIQPLLRMLVELLTQFTEQNALLAKAVQHSNEVSAHMTEHLEEYTRKTDQQIQALQLQGHLIEGSRQSIDTMQDSMTEALGRLPQQIHAEFKPLQSQLNALSEAMQHEFHHLVLQLAGLQTDLDARLPEAKNAQAEGKESQDV